MRRSPLAGSPRLAGDGDTPASDPLADLLFTLIAAVLPAILLLAPLSTRSRNSAQAQEAALAAATARAGIVLEGAPVRPLVAGADGIRIGGGGGRLVDLDRIGEDAGLAAELDRSRADGRPPVLLVEPDGLESAFLLDPVLAEHGVDAVREIRSASPCAEARETASRAICSAGAAP